MGTTKFHICNIVSDEKFIDAAIEGMDLYIDKWSVQWILCQCVAEDIKLIKRHRDRVVIVAEDDVLNYILTNKFDAVILHSFGVISPFIIKNIPKNIKVFWFGWGYDIYNYPIYKPFLKWDLYEPYTKCVYTSLYSGFQRFKSKLRFIFKGYGDLYMEALNRVDFFSGVLDFEYDLLSKNPYFRAKKVRFSYSSLLGLKSYEEYERCNGNNILVGNSAALENNHLDVLEYLKRLDLEGRKIILPLSYAGPEEYVKKVEEAYKSVWGENVVVLVDFIPFDEYVQYIQSCSVAVFFMKRQQAMGNINKALNCGCKVFLSEKNPVYQYYQNKGVHIYSVENNLDSKAINEFLSDSEVNQNRAVLKDLNDYDAFLKKLETIYNALL